MKPMDQEDILTINNNNNILNRNNKSPNNNNNNYYNSRAVMDSDRQNHGKPMPGVRRCSYSQIGLVDHYEKSPINNKNRGLIVHETFFKVGVNLSVLYD